jgi:thiamine biosynthesis lipoprotein
LATVVPARPHGPETLERFEYTEYHMGVDVRMVVYTASKQQAETAVAAAFEEFAALDTIMSDYRPNSEQLRHRAKAGGPPVPVSKDLFTVLERGQIVARRSGGAFDVTCGPEIALWRAARKTHSLPDPREIARARALVGWRKLRLDPRRRTAQLLVRGMKLDLGGIAKGYADDRAQAVLKKHGITRALVEAGGDIVVTNPPPDTKGWRIQVANSGGAAKPATLLFSNCAVSTSGDTEQFVTIGGRRFSHIVDPRTGWALTDRIQVTIVAPNGLLSDSLSTAVSVLGEKSGRALARKDPGTRCYVRFLGSLDTVPTRPEPRTQPTIPPPGE